MHDYRVLLKVMILGLKKYIKKHVLHNEFCLCMIIGCC